MSDRRPTGVLAAVAILALMGVGPGLARAQTTYWQVLSGDWSGLGRWDPAEPDGYDTAYINNGGTAQITEYGEVCAELILGEASGERGYVNMSAGDLSCGTMTVGYTGRGGFTQAAGTVMANELYIGRVTTSSYCHYEIQGGVLQTGMITVGPSAAHSGAGKLTYSGGTIHTGTIFVKAKGTVETTTDWICNADLDISGGTVDTGSNYLVVQSPGMATMYLRSGSVSSNQMDLGWYAGESGTLEQDGGSLTVATLLALGSRAGSSGTANIRGGTVSAADMAVGFSGGGTVTHSGGTVQVGSEFHWLNLAREAGSIAIYNLYGTGDLQAHNLCVGVNGWARMTQTGGTCAVANVLHVGYGGGATGEYNLSAGSLTAGSLRLGASGGQADFNYNGGTLTAGEVIVHPTGTFTANRHWSHMGDLDVLGGTVTTGMTYDLTLDGGASATVSSGSVSCRRLVAGPQGTGTVTQTGGTVTSQDYVVLGRETGSTGTYSLQGGELNAPLLYVGGYGGPGYTGNGQFYWTAGDLNVGEVQVRRGHMYVYDDWSFDGPLTVSNGTLNMYGNTLTLNNNHAAQAVTISGGQLYAGNLRVCDGGHPVTLDQTGGTVDVDLLHIARTVHHEGTEYNLSNGSLTAGALWIGQMSRLNWTGGTLTAPVMYVFGQMDGAQDWTYAGQLNLYGRVNFGTHTVVLNGPGGEDPHVLGGEMTARYIAIGQGEAAMAEMSGNLTATNWVAVGDDPGGIGGLRMTSGTLSAGRVYIAKDGASGQLDYQGGTIDADEVHVEAKGYLTATGVEPLRLTADLYVQGGVDVGEAGLVMGSAGDAAMLFLSDGYVLGDHIGVERGSVVHSNGLCRVYEDLRISAAAPSDADYQLSGAGQLLATAEYLGYGGYGSFSQSGGEHYANILHVGTGNGSEGMLNTGGGVFAAGQLLVGGDYGTGTWTVTGPATITVTERLVFGANSYFFAVPGTVIHMTGSHLELQGADPANLPGLGNLAVIFEGGPAQLDDLEAASAIGGGFVDNFALGEVILGDADVALVRLVDLVDNGNRDGGAECLYVHLLNIGDGSRLDVNALTLFVEGDVEAILDDWIGGGNQGRLMDGTLGPGEYLDAFYDPGSSSTSIRTVPEPAALGLLALGALALIRRRRR